MCNILICEVVRQDNFSIVRSYDHRSSILVTPLNAHSEHVHCPKQCNNVGRLQIRRATSFCFISHSCSLP